MKRENFRITSTIGHDVTKHKWNSSIREIERLVGELVKDVGATYCLTGSLSNKEDGKYTNGNREWTNQSNGCVVVFTINKVE